MSKQIQQPNKLPRRALRSGQRLSAEDRKAPRVTVEEFTAEIRKTIGTPFHHCGRVSGPNGGLDCGGMLVVSLQALGFEVHDKSNYGRGDNIADMVSVLQDNLFSQKKQGEAPTAGDVILIRGTGVCFHHLVYLTEDGTILHSWVASRINRVVESQMLPEWWNNIHSVWRFEGLQ